MDDAIVHPRPDCITIVKSGNRPGTDQPILVEGCVETAYGGMSPVPENRLADDMPTWAIHALLKEI